MRRVRMMLGVELVPDPMHNRRGSAIEFENPRDHWNESDGDRRRLIVRQHYSFFRDFSLDATGDNALR